MEVDVKGFGIIEFPDSMTPDQIKAVLDRDFGSPIARVATEVRTYAQQPAAAIGEHDWVNKDQPPAHRLLSAMQDPKLQEFLREQGAEDYALERLPFLGTGMNFLTAKQTREAAERFAKGNPTDNDIIKLAAEFRRQQVESEKGMGRRAFDMASMLPAFGAEFAAAGPAGRVGSAAAKAALARVSTRIPAGITAIGEFAGNVAGRTLQQLYRVPESVERDRLYRSGTRSLGRQLVNGILDVAIENASELMGGQLSRLAATKALKTAMAKAFGSRPGRTVGQFSKLLDRAGLHGATAEILEERVGELARGATGVTDDFGVFSDTWREAAEQIAVEALAFLPLSIGHGASNLAARPELAQAMQKALAAVEAPQGPQTPAAGQTAAEPRRPAPQPQTAQEEAEAYFSANPEAVERVAALPPGASRSQFAEATGIPRDRAARPRIDAFLQEARLMKGVFEALELGPEPPAAEAQAPGATLPERTLGMSRGQARAMLRTPEAREELRRTLNDLSGSQIATMFGLSPERRKQELIDIITRSFEPKRPETSQARPETSQARPEASQARPEASQARPEASQARPEASPPAPKQATLPLQSKIKRRPKPRRAAPSELGIESAFGDMGEAIAFNARLGAANSLKRDVKYVTSDPEIAKVYASELDEHLGAPIVHLRHPDGRNLFIDPNAKTRDETIGRAQQVGFVPVSGMPAAPETEAPKPPAAEAPQPEAGGIEKRADGWYVRVSGEGPFQTRERAIQVAEETNRHLRTQFGETQKNLIDDVGWEAQQKGLFDQPQPAAEAPQPAKPKAAPRTPAKRQGLPTAEADKRVKQLVGSLRRGGRPVKLVPPTTQEHADVIEFGRLYGVHVEFYETTGEHRTRGAALDTLEGVALVRSDLTEDALWGVAGHEIAHATGIDKLREEFDPALVDRYARQYYKNAAPEIKKRLDDNPELMFREGVARLVQQFMVKPHLRARIKKERLPLFRRILDSLQSLFLPFRPESKQFKRLSNLLERIQVAEEDIPLEPPADLTEAQKAEWREQYKEYQQYVEMRAGELADIHNTEASEFNDQLRNLAEQMQLTVGAMGAKARGRERAAGDPSQIKNFDKWRDMAEREYPLLLQGPSTQEDNLFQNLQKGLKPMLTRREARNLAIEEIGDFEMIEDPTAFGPATAEGEGDPFGEMTDEEYAEYLRQQRGGDTGSIGAAARERFPDDPTDYEEATQRYEDRANPSTTLGGRRETFFTDVEQGRVRKRKRSVAERQAAARLNRDAEGEKRRFIKRFADEQTPLMTEIDTVIVRRLIDDISIASYFDSAQARDDLRALVSGYRRSRTEAARALGLQDPILPGRRQTLGQRNLTVIKEALSTIDEATLRKVMEVLKKNHISLKDIDRLAESDEYALKIIRVLWDSQPHGSPFDAAFELWMNSILSGPQTQLVNALSAPAFGGYSILFERGLEALLNKAIGRQKGAQLGEFRYMLRGVMPGLRQAWANMVHTWKFEESAFAILTGSPELTAIEGPSRKVIRGKLGRAVRALGYRPLTAIDDFNKTFFAYMDVGAQAYRIATTENLFGAYRDTAIRKMVADLDSDAWREAVKFGYDVTFQQKGGKLTQDVRALGAQIKKTIPGMRWIIPFPRISTNIFAAALSRMPGLGLYAAWRRQQQGDDVNWSNIASQQIIGVVGLLALSHLVEGDDDDDKKPLLITGSSKLRKSERDLQYRTNPPMSIRIGGKWYQYSRIEPFATQIGAAADAITAIKRGEIPAWDILYGQINDKTFLSGLSDILSPFESREYSVYNAGAGIASGFVPNLYRQVAVAWDDRLLDTRIRKRDSASDIGRKLMMRAQLPGVGYIYQRDIWGRQINKDAPGTSLPWRVFSPMRMKIGERQVVPADRALQRWNERHPDKAYAPSLPQPFYGPGNKTPMTLEQYEEFLTRSGKLAFDLTSPLRFTDPPTEDQIETIRRVFAAARRQVKAEMFPR